MLLPCLHTHAHTHIPHIHTHTHTTHTYTHTTHHTHTYTHTYTTHHTLHTHRPLANQADLLPFKMSLKKERKKGEKNLLVCRVRIETVYTQQLISFTDLPSILQKCTCIIVYIVSKNFSFFGNVHNYVSCVWLYLLHIVLLVKCEGLVF